MARRGKKRERKIFTNVKITGIADKGKGVGRSEEGEVIFVERVAPGDIVDVQSLRKKKGVAQGYPIAFHHLSEDRVEPTCEHFEQCGGCKWQHLSYEKQLSEKDRVVRDAVRRLAKVEVADFQDILACEETLFYRNKMEFTFCNKRWLTEEEVKSGVSNEENVLGFHRAGAFDKILNVDKCWLQYEPSNAIRNFMRELAEEQELTFYDPKMKTGMMRNVFIRITSLGEILIIMVFRDPAEKKIKKYMDALIEKFPNITSAYTCVNPKVNDYVGDMEMKLFHGAPYIRERLRHVEFKVGPKSFFQTNTKQAENLYDVIVDFAGLDGSQNVYDLYTGVGSIALYLAKSAKQVVGIEELAPAIEDAKENAKMNEIDNCIFYAGDVKDILTDEFAKEHGQPDLVITDPPRAGMHGNVIDMFLKLESPKIVYVSCNPSTQARDLALLSEKYDVSKMRAVDMFPHTHHIESVALLELKKEFKIV